jgi:Zn-dependent peptidase ImmA (M78 family)
MLGISQLPAYDGGMEAEIGARVRERLRALQPPVKQAEMAARLDLAPDAFSRSLNGQRAFTAIELVKLAEELKTSAHWFVTGEPDPFAVTFAGRHTYDPELKDYLLVDWDSVKDARNRVAHAYIQAYGEMPPREPRTRIWSAREARARLVEVGGEDFVRALADNLERAFDIDIVRLDGIKPDFALSVLGREVIVLEASAYWFRENFSIAHELAHILLGHLASADGVTCDDPPAERAANAFAAELLTPKEEFRALEWSTLSPKALAEYVWKAGVSTKMVQARLSSLKLRPAQAITDAVQLKSQVLIQRELPELSDDVSARMSDARQRRFPEHLVSAHSLAVSTGALPPDTLAWMLAEPVELIRDELAPAVAPADLDWLANELGLGE